MRALWVHRNMVRFASAENKPFIHATWNSIKCNFTKAINLELNRLYPYELEKFKTKFCHTPRIIQLQNDELLYVNSQNLVKDRYWTRITKVFSIPCIFH